MDNRTRTGKVEHGEGGVTIRKIFPDYGDRSEQDAEGDEETRRETETDQETIPIVELTESATADATEEQDDDDDDDIVPGPLDEEDAGVADDHSPLSNSVPGEDLPPDVDDGDPQGPGKPEIKDPLV